MSTLGKILVVLNSVVAIVVIVFLVHKFAAETNTQTVAKLYEDQLRVARTTNNDLVEKNNRIMLELRTTIAAIAGDRQQREVDQAGWQAEEAALRKASADAKILSEQVTLNQQKVDEARKRMEKEVQGLAAIVDDREGRIVTLHQKFLASQTLEMALNRDVKLLQGINKVLVERNARLELALEELAKPQGESSIAKGPLAPNPPAKFLKGVVERVDSTDGSLVLVSLGSDHGLKRNHTLEVFRLSPVPEYLGMMRIEDTHPQVSVGKLVVRSGRPPRAVKDGDLVSSQLTPR